jgi:hypothetical protein
LDDASDIDSRFSDRADMIRNVQKHCERRRARNQTELASPFLKDDFLRAENGTRAAGN